MSEQYQKSMQKKVIISLAFLCIALILVAGCSSSSKPTATSSAPAPIPTVKTTRATTVPTTAVYLDTYPSQFSGSGDDVVSFTATGSGLRVFDSSYTGKSNFIVWLEDSGGEKTDLIVNKIGTYSGKKSVRLTSGKYYLDVKADGQWTVIISSP